MVERSGAVPIEMLEELVAAAVLAPSSHNTQPWLFELHDGEINVHADRIRALPVNDPHDRELTISCGCALRNLELAAGEHDLTATVSLLPDDLRSRRALPGRRRSWCAVPSDPPTGRRSGRAGGTRCAG